MSKTILTKSLKTPAGELISGSFQDKLCLCDWKYRKMRESIDKRIASGLNAEFQEGDSPVLQQLEEELSDYFQGKRKTFDVPLLLVGTDFQKQVWHELMNIPFGETSTYLALSQKLRNEKAIRAVASANGANAISILVPCHRIIGHDGSLVGYAGGLPAKRKLLDLEMKEKSEQLALFG